VEVVDGFIADGYAWLAVSRFEPAVIKIPEGAVGDPESAKADLLRLAGQLKLAPLAVELEAAANSGKQAAVVRMAACDALVSLQSPAATEPLSSLLADAQLAAADRQQAAELLGRLDRDAARQVLVKQLKTAPQPVAVAIAGALSSKREAGELLLAEIRAGRASPALLREATVVARLKTAGIAKLDDQIAELTARLSPADDRVAKLLQTRREKFLAGKYNAETGKAVFAKSACAQCHKVGETGATIAPALDGIGTRGLERLLEDVLDPNRNVDQAFRVTSITTQDGLIVNGFGPREEGQTLVLFDQTGKAVRLQTADIAERAVLPLSPMPANLSEQIPEDDFYQLMAYLLSQKAKE
jgi:putative heme-binding domain-containing protein